MHTENVTTLSHLTDFANSHDPIFTKSIILGLKTSPQKTIASKWLYDENGSKLFDDITELDE